MPKKAINKKGGKVVIKETIMARPFNSKGKKAPTPPPRPAMETASYKLACSIADPWSCSACVPDGSTGTGCFTLKQQDTISTGTDGCAFFALNVDPASLTKNIAGAAVSGASNYVAATQVAMVKNGFKNYRPISAGIRVTYIGNTQTDGGYIILGQTPANKALMDFNPVSASTMADNCAYTNSIPLRNGAQITWRPESQSDLQDWRAIPGGTQLLSAGTSYPQLVIGVMGATASTAVLAVELVVNYEGQFQIQSLQMGGEAVQQKVKAEVGWFEKVKNVLALVRPVISVAATTAMRSPNPVVATVGALANGLLAAGSFAKSRRIRN